MLEQLKTHLNKSNIIYFLFQILHIDIGSITKNK